MADLNSFGLKLRFSGTSVDAHGLDLYDGATSFYGFAKALQIAAHAYVTGEVVSRATALKGAELYFGSPRRGSVLFDVVTVLKQYPVTGGPNPSVFYDFMKTAFSRATGNTNARPETAQVTKISEDETFFDALSEMLEGSLQQGHRAIDHGVSKITLERPRSELVTFNQKTSKWVNTREENPEAEEFTGNVTRYNSITGNGRAYIRELEKVIPFRPGPTFPETQRGWITWSLHGNNVSTKKELKIWASRIDSAQGDPKRLILTNCTEIVGE